MEGIPAVKQFVGVPTTAPPTIYTGWLFAQFIPHFYVLERQLRFQFPSLLEFYSDWVPNPTLILTPTWMQWLLSHSHTHTPPMSLPCVRACIPSVCREGILLSSPPCRHSNIRYSLDCSGASYFDCHSYHFNGHLLLVLQKEPKSCHKGIVSTYCWEYVIMVAKCEMM